MFGARAKMITLLRNLATTPKPHSWRWPQNPVKIAGLFGKVWKTNPVLISGISAASRVGAAVFFWGVRIFRLLFLGLLLCGAPAQATQKATQKLVIAVLGDSLTSGFELSDGQGYVQVLEKELLAKGYNVDLRSAAIAGQSTRQGRDWVFIEPVLSADIVLLQRVGRSGGPSADSGRARASRRV